MELSHFSFDRDTKGVENKPVSWQSVSQEFLSAQNNN